MRTLAILLTLCGVCASSAPAALNKLVDFNSTAPWGEKYNAFSFHKVSGGKTYVLGTSPSHRGFVRFHDGEALSIADSTKKIPGTELNWTSFLTGDAEGNQFAFTGSAGSFSGVYLFDGSQIATLVDSSVIVPGTSLLFTNFGAPVLRGGQVAFMGQTAESTPRPGLFIADGDSLTTVIAPGTAYPGGVGTLSFTAQIGYGGGNSAVVIGSDAGATTNRSLFYADGGNITKLVEVNVTTVPGRENVFTGLSNPPYVVGSKVYFGGSFGTGSGIFSVNTDGSGLAVVVDTSMTPPGKVHKFISTFLRGVTSDHIVYFDGTDGGFGQGVYRLQNGTITKVLATFETWDGKTVVALIGSGDPMADHVAVLMSFSDNTRALYSTATSMVPTPQFRLVKSVSPAAGGIITVNPSSTNGYYLSNTIVTLTATPNHGYRFIRWSGSNTSTNTTINLAMRAKKTVTALFTNLPRYKITTAIKPAGAGTITLSPFAPTNIYVAGTVVGLTATPTGTNVFSAWIGAAPALDSSASTTANANKSVTALFNNPGRFLFQNTSGQVAVWFTQNTQRLASVLLNSGVTAGSNWRLATTGDLDANGSKDLIFRGTNGQVSAWMMEGNIPANSVLLREGEVMPSSWRLVAAEDFNNDSSPDLLWQNTNRVLNVWLMDGTNYLSTETISPVPGAGYKALAAGQFNANVWPEIFLQNSNGKVAVWLMDGLTRTSAKVLNGGVSPGSGWILAGAIDVNGDKQNDLVFRKSDGAVKVWIMNGLAVKRSVLLSAKAARPWVLRGLK